MDIWFTLFVFAVTIAVAVGGSLLLVGYINVLPACLVFGWRFWVPTLVFPVLGPIWFCRCHPADFSRTGKQLMAGLALIILAAGMVYGLGPVMAERAVQMKSGVK